MQSLFDRIIFLTPNSPGEVFWDLLQILVVAYGFYRLLLLVAGTRAIQMLLGLILLFATYALAEVLELELIRYLLQIMATYGAKSKISVWRRRSWDARSRNLPGPLRFPCSYPVPRLRD